MVLPESRGDVIELRTGPTIQFCNAIGIGENEIFRNLTKFNVLAKQSDPLLLLSSFQKKIRSLKEGLSHELSDVTSQFWINCAADKAFPKNDVRGEILHYHCRGGFIEGIRFGDKGRARRPFPGKPL